MAANLEKASTSVDLFPVLSQSAAVLSYVSQIPVMDLVPGRIIDTRRQVINSLFELHFGVVFFTTLLGLNLFK